jgi:hypothetical protein
METQRLLVVLDFSDACKQGKKEGRMTVAMDILSKFAMRVLVTFSIEHRRCVMVLDMHDEEE